jgi:hypothetical protein
MRWTGHVEQIRKAYKILIEKPIKKNYLRDAAVDGKITLRWILDWIHLAQNMVP